MSVPVRRYERFHLDKRVKIHLENDHNSQVVGRMINVSEGGIGAVLPDAILSPGQFVTLGFSLGKEESVSVRAVVRNHNGFRVGFEFLTLSTSQRRVIKQMFGRGPTGANAGKRRISQH